MTGGILSIGCYAEIFDAIQGRCNLAYPVNTLTHNMWDAPISPSRVRQRSVRWRCQRCRGRSGRRWMGM